jgi:uncharacterized protein (DUF488 family)
LISGSSATIWTVGHSTRAAAEFSRLLQHHEIELVADVRRFPGSRRLPQFSSAALARDLEDSGIHYVWLPELGGRRRPLPDSVNTGWRNASFRGYADHLATEEFADGLNELVMLASGLRTTVMCAEVLWWRCHRRIIADVLTAMGWRVLHIQDEKEPTLHRLTPPAKLFRGVVRYQDE